MKLAPFIRLRLAVPKQSASPTIRPRRSAVLARRQARAALAFSVTSFLVIVLAWNVVADRFHPEWRDPHYAERLRNLKAAVARSGKPLIVCSGTSRSWNALCSEDFGKQEDCLPVNWAFGAELMVRQLMAYRRLKAERIPVRGMLIEVFPAGLLAPEPNWQLLDPHKMRFRDLGLMQDELGGIPRLETIASRIDPVSDTRLRILADYAPSLIPAASKARVSTVGLQPLGWAPFAENALDGPAQLRQRELMRGDYEMTYRLKIRANGATRALEKLLDECRADGVPAGLYITPEDDMFRSFQTTEFRQTFEAYLSTLRSKYGVDVLDFRETMPNDAFVDGHHMFENPSRRFTRDHFLPAALGWWRGQSVRASVD